MAKFISVITSLSQKESEWLTDRLYSKLRDEIKKDGVYITGVGYIEKKVIPARSRMVFGEMKDLPPKVSLRYHPNKKLLTEIEEENADNS